MSSQGRPDTEMHGDMLS